MILPFASSLRLLVLLAAALFGLQPPLRSAPAFAVGDMHSLWLKADGSVWACGDNDYGQLGDGTFIDRSIPVRVMNDVKAISAGSYQSLFLKTDGTAWACGKQFGDRIGDGPMTDRSAPAQVLTDVQAIYANGAFSRFLKIDGTIWGREAFIGNGEHNSIRQISKLSNLTFYPGNLSFAQFEGQYITSEQQKHITTLENSDVEDFIVSGGPPYYLIVLKTNGTVYSVNFSSGIRTTLALSGVKAISKGYDGSGVGVSRSDVLYLMDDGKVWSGGYDGSTPELLGIDGVQAVAGSWRNVIILKSDGTIWGLGPYNGGLLGNGGFWYQEYDRPVRFGRIIAGVSKTQRGQVWVLRDGQKSPSGLNDEFYEGDVVITGPKSLVKISLSDGSEVNVGSGSELKLEKFRPKEPSIMELIKGRVRSRILNNGTGAIKLWFNTRYTTLGVRGTEFDVTYSEENGVGTTRLDVLSGLVDMTDLSTQQTVGVGAGESRSTVAVAVPRPVMTVQPANGAVVNGQTLSASIVAEGALSYQWSKDGENIAGATARTYTLANAQLADAGAYTCAVTYADNSVSPYLSNPIWVSVYPETQLAIRTQPLKQTGAVGEAAFFSIIATSTEPVAYQWNKDGVPISGATAATYSLANIQIADTGVYTCSVRDADEQVLSGTAMLTVYAGGISGIVTSAQTGQPLADIEVRVYRQNVGASTVWGLVDSTSTAAGGDYQFPHLVQGTYRIRFRDVQRNYIGEYHNNSPSLDAATDILVPAEKAVTGIDALLAKASLITGKVTGPDGTTPLANINVSAYRWTNTDGGHLEFMWSGDTDLNGNYSIGGLAAGTYHVGFDELQGNYVDESYADAVDLRSGTDIVVPVGTTVTGIDASLASVAPPEPAVIVKFQITSAGQYEIHYTGKIGQTYIIQKRNSLSTWTDESPHTCQSGVNIVPVTSSASSMFWRLKTAP
jgi:hypothetical protein